MRYTRFIAVLALCVTMTVPAPSPVIAQDAAEEVSGGILPAALGGVAGVIGGGYITVSLIVLQSRRGHYLHDISDVLDWKSVSVIVGGATGAALGMWSPERLKIGTLWGLGGAAVGLGTGLAIGPLIWDDPEGKWAAAAIGAGAGLAVGSVLGIIVHELRNDGDGGASPAATRVPIGFTVNF